MLGNRRRIGECKYLPTLHLRLFFFCSHQKPEGPKVRHQRSQDKSLALRGEEVNDMLLLDPKSISQV